MDQSEESCPLIPLYKLLKATNDFEDALVIGTERFGKVYRSIIWEDDTNTAVTIKRLNAESKQGAEEFWTEVKLLSKIKHTNLVSIIGYCNENQEMILVYEYIARGTLANHIYKTSGEGGKSVPHLTWMERLKICLGAAQGLDFLHNGTNGQGIIHRDVKSRNILLDDLWVAKVSNFGLSISITSTHVRTNVAGTIGYLDPDYFFTNRVTKKSDVYAFGVMLLEVMSGRPPVDTRLEEEQISLILWTKLCIKKGKLDRIIDPSLNGEITLHSLKYFVKLATDCLNTEPKERPPMSKVVEILEIALASHDRKGRSQGTMKEFVSLRPPNHSLQDPILDNVSPTAEGPSKNSFQDQSDESCPLIPLYKLLKATNHFDDALVIGTGGFGKVYRSIIWDDDTNTVVAIKRLNAESKQGAEEFWAEIKLLSKFKHTNLVSVIGYCNENQEMILVYEYVARGTLASHIYKTSGEERGEIVIHLTWMERLKICLGAARGLDFLHNGTNGQGIIHRDVKSTNILLDDLWEAKVSDFGLSKSITTTHVSTNVKGSFGYFDPDYFFTGRLTKKSDVYAFGAVLLEVMCGRPAVDTRLEEDQISLIRWAQMWIKKGKLDRIIDPSLKGETTPHSLKCFVKLATDCLNTEPKERPPMSKVVEILENALASHERKGRSQGTMRKAIHWWRPPKNLLSPTAEGPSKNSFQDLLFDNNRPTVHQRFSLATIHEATNNFNQNFLIGTGSSFRLYKGCMDGGTFLVAIQTFDSICMEAFREMIRKYSWLHHRNIISLMGFCDTNLDGLILVHDDMANGTLRSHLHKKDNCQLLWKKRLEICIDTARGLEYLHRNVKQGRFHHKIETSNILLDDKWRAKVADFEIFDTEVMVTSGFSQWQHDLMDFGFATTKMDVAAFGDVLLEVLCARTSYCNSNQNWNKGLVDSLLSCIQRGTIEEIIDSCLVGKIAPECFRHYVKIVVRCLASEGFKRPSMNDVLDSLECSLQMQEDWENSIEKGDKLRMAKSPDPTTTSSLSKVCSQLVEGGILFQYSELCSQSVEGGILFQD